MKGVYKWTNIREGSLKQITLLFPWAHTTGEEYQNWNYLSGNQPVN